jgi:epoxyqueuosine reductase QueG
MADARSLKKDLVAHCESIGVLALKSVSLDSLRDSGTLHEGAQRVLPGVRSIISFTRSFPKGAMHLLKDETRGLPFYSRLAGLGARDLDDKSLNLCLFVESRGYQAVPVFSCVPMEVPEKLDLRGYISQIDLAARSGLGWIGKNGLLISPTHGTRVGIGTVLTDAEFEHDAPLAQGCPEDCFLCVERCPVAAIDGTGKVDRLQCTSIQAMAPVSRMLAKDFPVKENISMLVNMGAVDEHIWYQCHACVVSCPIGT